jgi:hypothetical protein
MEVAETNVYALWAKWYFSDRSSRHINPDSQVTVAQLVNRKPQHSASLRLSPTNALALASFARSALASDRRGFVPNRTFPTASLVEALESIELALASSPGEPEVWQARAEFWREAGNLTEALDAADKASQLSPERAEIWSLRASLLESTSRIEEALQCASRAIALAQARTSIPPSALVTNLLLQRYKLLRHLNRPVEAQSDLLLAKGIPARDRPAKAALIDLTQHYNAGLAESWHGGAGRSDLSALAPGTRRLAGVEFDLRGLVQVGNQSRDGLKYPPAVTDIPIEQPCRKLQFLHSAIFATTTTNGTPIGRYIVRYADGRTNTVPIVFGRDVANWGSHLKDDLGGVTVAWEGESAADKQRKRKVRLFKTTWENPWPEVAIKSIDLVAGSVEAKPFLVAITAE